MVAVFFSIEWVPNKLDKIEFVPVDCKVVEVVVVEVVVLSVVVVLVDVVVVVVVVSSIVSSFSLILLILSTLSIPAKVVLDKVPFVLFAATACKFLPNDFPKKVPRSIRTGICLFCLLDVLIVQYTKQM